MESEGTRSSIRLGVDFGSTTCRVAYVHPGPEQVVVPVPIALDQFRPCFPIAEKLPSNDLYVARFFPGLLQRMMPDFLVTLDGAARRTRDVTAELVGKAVSEGQRFSGRSIEGLLLCHPIGIDTNARIGLLEAIRSTGLPASLASEADAACAFFRANEMRDDEHATVLVLCAGYAGVGLAVARITPRGVRVLAKVADPGLLGGNILDFIIMQSAVKQLEEARVMLADPPQATRWSTFQYSVEAAKHAVRDTDGAVFHVPEALTPDVRGPLRMTLVGSAFRALVNRHLDAAFALADALLADTRVDEQELGYVLLVGGATHLPDVPRRIGERFGPDKARHLPPDAVAGGGALLALQLSAMDMERDPYVLPRTEPFMPAIRDLPGLVTLDVPADHQETASRQVPIAAPPPPVGSETLVQSLTLQAIRARIEAGDVDGALFDLHRLYDAVRQELVRHERPGPLTH